MRCSGNIVKNMQGVTVPNSGGLKGIEAAAILGALGGDALKGIEVLEELECVRYCDIWFGRIGLR
nr:hypothetical protein [Anaerobium acetethylicum]